MKVAIFTDTYYPQINGVVKTLTKFTEYLDENGIDYKVIAPKFDGFYDEDKVIRIKSFKFILYPECRITVPYYQFICKQMDGFKPDIVHVMTEFCMGVCGMKYAKSRNIPVVSSYETNIPQYMEYYHLKAFENKSWQFFRWFHESCNKTYCPSETTQKLLESKGITNVEVWDRGVELDKFSPRFRDKNLRKSYGIDDKIVFLYVGRISREKNLKLFLKVANKLNEKYRNKIHFMIVGEGPSLGMLKRNAPSNMTFTGFLTGIKLSKVYASSDIFLFTSSTETLGLVLLEAMASGLAVISSNEGGASENLIEGYNCIAPSEDEESFYKAAEKLILDPELRKKLSDNALKINSAKEWSTSFNDLINDYRKFILTE
jgi:glycosyltransferase involved in cell wall biosynthesis